MIYEVPSASDAICQGDIFRDVPLVELSLAKLSVVEDGGELETTWNNVLDAYGAEPITVLLPIRPVLAIVITQNCDAVRSPSLSLCEIRSYLSEKEKLSPPSSTKKWVSKLMENARAIPRSFYLPSDGTCGIEEKKAVDFRSVIRVPRVDLEGMRDRRICRLNSVANEHFRESLAQFFRRYPVNEWYPLTHEEFIAYQAACDEPIEPYTWQKDS